MQGASWRVPALAVVLLSLPLAGFASLPWSWGANNQGQLGDGTSNERWTPGQSPNLGGIVAIAAGEWHSLALRSDGTVWAWGDNSHGQLGDGTIEDRSTPVQVYGLTDVIAIACGYYHSLAVRADGTVWAWGYNEYGQLGNGTTIDCKSPVQVVGLTGVIAVAGGFSHSMALTSVGTVYAWGNNGSGQLGNGTNDPSDVPGSVLVVSQVVSIACGGYHSLAVQNDGTVWAWGDNSFGQLGNGTTSASNLPVQVLTGAVAVSAGYRHSLALMADGTVRAWGDNVYGQLGDRTLTQRTAPVQTVEISDVVVIAAGYYHSLAVKSDGTAWGWGNNSNGQLGCGGNASQWEPRQVDVLDRATAIAGGGYHSMALQSEATALTVPDRTGTITEPVTLRAYLSRLSDNAWLDGKTVTFSVDGTVVGSGVTGASGSPGRADFTWLIEEGPGTRTILGTFAGDSQYEGSSDTGTLTCQSWATKMATFDRTQRITGRTELKCRLLRSDNVPLSDKRIGFYVDGTLVIVRPTTTQGYASYPFYDVPDGAGAGERTILCVWPGNGGYAAVSKTAKLTVLKAMPYIWVCPKSCPAGGMVGLYAYFRRLYDYAKQEGKQVTFRVDGTWIADVTTGSGTTEPGVARHVLHTTGLGVGTHTIRCEFAGDAWVDAGYGESTLTIY